MHTIHVWCVSNSNYGRFQNLTRKKYVHYQLGTWSTNTHRIRGIPISDTHWCLLPHLHDRILSFSQFIFRVGGERNGEWVKLGWWKKWVGVMRTVGSDSGLPKSHWFAQITLSKNLMSECQPRQKIPNFLHWGKKTIMSQLTSKYHRKLRHYNYSLQSVIDAKLHTDIKYQTKCLKRNYSTKKNEIIDRDALVPSWLLAGSSLRTIVEDNSFNFNSTGLSIMNQH
jgi:hypothetical protein